LSTYIVAIGLCLMSLFISDAGVGATSAADQWRALTRIDAEAAYNLLNENHPGALPQVGDATFRATLTMAYEHALSRAADVTGYGGYVAALGEFAGAMGDGHIQSRPLFLPRTVAWTGLIAVKRGPDWFIANEEPKIAGFRLTGTRIVSCSGDPVASWSRESLHFRTTASVEAMLVNEGGWLLVDDGNPFIERPSSCVFEQDGMQSTISLHWTKISRDKLLQHYWVQPYGAAGYGLRRSGSGYWVALQELTPPAQQVVDAVQAQESDLRAAPFVVVDLRGNGGGDDAYGRALADELYGKSYVNAVLGSKVDASGECDPVFRASEANIAAAVASEMQFRNKGDEAAAKDYAAAANAMKSAVAAGRALTGSPVCALKRPIGARIPLSLMRGRVFVLTASACFSSCIQMVMFFRKLGATQIGQATAADTHYSEYREIVLPSGLSAFRRCKHLYRGQLMTWALTFRNMNTRTIFQTHRHSKNGCAASHRTLSERGSKSSVLRWHARGTLHSVAEQSSHMGGQNIKKVSLALWLDARER
jgi:hypothetical protein